MEGSIAYMRMKHGSSSMEYPLLYTHTQDAAVALNISSSQQVGVAHSVMYGPVQGGQNTVVWGGTYY